MNLIMFEGKPIGYTDSRLKAKEFVHHMECEPEIEYDWTDGLKFMQIMKGELNHHIHNTMWETKHQTWQRWTGWSIQEVYAL